MAFEQSTTQAPTTPATTTPDRLIDAFVRFLQRVRLFGYYLGVVVLWLVAIVALYPRVSADFDNVLWLVFGSAVIMGALLTVPGIALGEYQRRRDTARFLSGEAWAVWRYNDDERQQIAQLGFYSEARGDMISILLRLLLVAATFIGVFAYIGLAALGVFVAIGMGLVGALLAFPAYRRAHRRKDAHARGLREVIIGPSGICEDGVYTPLTEPLGYFLSGATLKPGNPAVLRFERSSRHTSYDITNITYLLPGPAVRVAVPHDREEEGAALIERFLATK